MSAKLSRWRLPFFLVSWAETFTATAVITTKLNSIVKSRIVTFLKIGGVCWPANTLHVSPRSVLMLK